MQNLSLGGIVSVLHADNFLAHNHERSPPSAIITNTKEPRAESPLGGKCQGGDISCSLIGYSNLSRRKILAVKSRDCFYFSQRDIFPPRGDAA